MLISTKKERNEMAKIIITGTKRESKVILQSLEEVLKVRQLKTVFVDEKEAITIIDAFVPIKDAGKLSDEEIEKALTCHSHRGQKCKECPFLGIPNCGELAITEFSLLMRRRFAEIEKNGGNGNASND